MGIVQDPKPSEEEKKEEKKEEMKEEPKKKEKKKKKKKQPVLDDNGNPIEGVEVEVEVEEATEEEEKEKAKPEEHHEPESYTICAPQLLHLDVDGSPLWFNGWLQDNKFADKKKRKFGKFEHYLIEPRDIRDPGAWQLEESNMCCLTTDPDLKKDFTQAEKDLLEMMIQQARDVGMSG
jgi:hypothetical protein